MIGRTINNYEVRALIAEGGMGAVYLAEHPFLKRKAAIKFLRSSLASDEAIVARFMNEARAANAIRHPHIVDVIDVGRLPDGPPYLMMELLEGETLAARLGRVGRLCVSEAVEIAREAAAGLAAAHDKGIIHLDLKPDNLFLASDPTSWRGERTKILDFGIAKLHPGMNAIVPTGNDDIAGTPAYMSPEQCRVDGVDIDPRADVYALGAVLYHMLCGTPPFVDEAPLEVFVMHVVQPPVPPREHNAQIPAAVQATILRALAKEPSERFASMAQMRDALAPGGSFVPTVVMPRVKVKKIVRRSWMPLVGAAAVVVLAGALFWPGRRADPAGLIRRAAFAKQRRTPVTALHPVTTAKSSARSTPVPGPRPGAAATARLPGGNVPGRSATTQHPRLPAQLEAGSPPRRHRGARRGGGQARMAEQDRRRSRNWIDKW